MSMKKQLPGAFEDGSEIYDPDDAGVIDELMNVKVTGSVFGNAGPSTFSDEEEEERKVEDEAEDYWTKTLARRVIKDRKSMESIKGEFGRFVRKFKISLDDKQSKDAVKTFLEVLIERPDECAYAVYLQQNYSQDVKWRDVSSAFDVMREIVDKSTKKDGGLALQNEFARIMAIIKSHLDRCPTDPSTWMVWQSVQELVDTITGTDIISEYSLMQSYEMMVNIVTNASNMTAVRVAMEVVANAIKSTQNLNLRGTYSAKAMEYINKVNFNWALIPDWGSGLIDSRAEIDANVAVPTLCKFVEKTKDYNWNKPFTDDVGPFRPEYVNRAVAQRPTRRAAPVQARPAAPVQPSPRATVQSDVQQPQNQAHPPRRVRPSLRVARKTDFDTVEKNLVDWGAFGGNILVIDRFMEIFRKLREVFEASDPKKKNSLIRSVLDAVMALRRLKKPSRRDGAAPVDSQDAKIPLTISSGGKERVYLVDLEDSNGDLFVNDNWGILSEVMDVEESGHMVYSVEDPYDPSRVDRKFDAIHDS